MSAAQEAIANTHATKIKLESKRQFTLEVLHFSPIISLERNYALEFETKQGHYKWSLPWGVTLLLLTDLLSAA